MKLEDARVLVVDDEVALCGIFAKWLTRSGCRNIRTAANGEEAVEAIRQEPVDVLITDVRMPVMDGVTLVRKLAQQGERIHTIIFVSGFGDVDRREMYDLGVENFLAKPFRLEELADAVDQAIAERSTLWLSPMDSPPRQAVHVEVPEVPGVRASDVPGDGPEALGTRALGRTSHLCFSLGHGGFSARAEEPLGLGKVSFRCVFSNGDRAGESTPDLCGEGFVRWRSRTDQAVGIEFAYLESPGREWVVEQIAENNPRPFIPAMNQGTDSAEDAARRFASNPATLVPSTG
jgi:CheY-like chemotaxis protein